MIEEKQVEGPACVLHYAEGPDHGPPLLLLHGIMGSWMEFVTMLPALLPRWHVFALEFRGQRRGSSTGALAVAGAAAPSVHLREACVDGR